jgi:hypothetical protein
VQDELCWKCFSGLDRLRQGRRREKQEQGGEEERRRGGGGSVKEGKDRITEMILDVVV